MVLLMSIQSLSNAQEDESNSGIQVPPKPQPDNVPHLSRGKQRRCDRAPARSSTQGSPLPGVARLDLEHFFHDGDQA